MTQVNHVKLNSEQEARATKGYITGNKIRVLAATQWQANAQDFSAWVDRTERAGQEVVAASAANIRQFVSQGIDQVRAHRADYKEKLVSEVTQSQTASQLVNLLV